MLTYRRHSLLFALALALCCSFLVRSAAAQQPNMCDGCPPADTTDAQHNPATPPWNVHSINLKLFTSPGPAGFPSGCDATICYECRVTSAGNFDFMVTQVCIDSACWEAEKATLTGNTDSILIARANDALFTLLFQPSNPCGFNCPECPNGDLNWDQYTATCWRSVYVTGDPTRGTTSHYILKKCGDFGWCLNVYKVCCKNGHPTRTFDHTVQVTWTCGEQGCNAINCPNHLPDIP